jgi:hypothetical protein
MKELQIARLEKDSNELHTQIQRAQQMLSQ